MSSSRNEILIAIPILEYCESQRQIPEMMVEE
jgi:hypothetical protein